MKFKVYCDGAASNNGYSNAIGGWAYVVLDEEDNKVAEDSGRVELATNNRMELYAAYMGIYEALSQCDKVEELDVYTDSAYLHNCVSQKWWETWMRNGWINSKKELVANRSLWENLIPYFMSENIHFHKVKGHETDEWNNYVDNLAVAARKQEVE